MTISWQANILDQSLITYDLNSDIAQHNSDFLRRKVYLSLYKENWQEQKIRNAKIMYRIQIHA